MNQHEYGIDVYPHDFLSYKTWECIVTKRVWRISPGTCCVREALESEEVIYHNCGSADMDEALDYAKQFITQYETEVRVDN